MQKSFYNTPQDLMLKNLMDRIFICKLLLKRNKI